MKRGTIPHFVTQVNAGRVGTTQIVLVRVGSKPLQFGMWMTKNKNLQRPDHDLEAEALAALEEARAMPPGPERTRAMRKAGHLRNAADLLGIVFAKRGRPAKK